MIRSCPHCKKGTVDSADIPYHSFCSSCGKRVEVDFTVNMLFLIVISSICFLAFTNHYSFAGKAIFIVFTIYILFQKFITSRYFPLKVYKE